MSYSGYRRKDSLGTLNVMGQEHDGVQAIITWIHQDSCGG
jgi:hypothetical protein